LYPGEDDFYRCTLVEANPFVKFMTADGKTRTTKMLGAYNFENIAAALSVGKFFGVEEEKAIESISKFIPSNMRSQLIEKRSNLIVFDAYNANPSSMEKAIRAIGRMTGKKHKMVLVGDMFELGRSEIEEHRKLGEVISQMEID